MRRLAVAVFVGLLALAPIPAVAQGQNSAVQGHVLDESGAALPGVTVVVTHQGSGQFRQVVSNADGSYFVTGIIPSSALPISRGTDLPPVLMLARGSLPVGGTVSMRHLPCWSTSR